MRPSPVIVLLKAKSPPRQATLFPEMVPIRGHTRRDGTYVQPYQAIRQTAPESEIARIPPRFAKVEWDGLMSAWYAFDQFGRRMTGPDGAVRRFRTAEAAKRWGQEQDRRARAEVRRQYRAEANAAIKHAYDVSGPPRATYAVLTPPPHSTPQQPGSADDQKRIMAVSMGLPPDTYQRRTIDTSLPGDYGANPISDGTFKMVPSGDIVDRAERDGRLDHKRTGMGRVIRSGSAVAASREKARDAETRHRTFMAKMREAGITLPEYADFTGENRRYVMRRFGKDHIPPQASDEKALDAMIAARQAKAAPPAAPATQWGEHDSEAEAREAMRRGFRWSPERSRWTHPDHPHYLATRARNALEDHAPLTHTALRRLYREAVHGDGAGPRWAARDKIEQLVAQAGMTLRDAFHAANLDLRAYLASRPTSRSEGR